MTVQKSFTIYPSTVNDIDMTLTDVNGNIVSSASMIMTLYWGRDHVRPDATPGIAVANCSNVTMAFSSVTNAYTGAFVFTLVAAPPGGDYMVVMDATIGGLSFGHWERTAVVLEGGM